MQRSRFCRLGAVAAMALSAALTLDAAPAEARGGMKWIGLSHDLKVEGVVGRGDRWGQSGTQLLVQFEGAIFGKVSSLGNLAGLEFSAHTGYDGAPFKASDGLLGETSMIPFEMAIGFPVTLFNWVRGRDSLLMIGVAPGYGFNWLNAFTYLKAKAAGRIGPRLVAELQWTWRPGAASYSFGDEDRGINAATLRATVYVAAKRDTAFFGFAELVQSQREETVYRGSAPGVQGGNQSATLYGGKDPFGATKRVAFEDFIRVGGGYAF